MLMHCLGHQQLQHSEKLVPQNTTCTALRHQHYQCFSFKYLFMPVPSPVSVNICYLSALFDFSVPLLSFIRFNLLVALCFLLSRRARRTRTPTMHLLIVILVLLCFQVVTSRSYPYVHAQTNNTNKYLPSTCSCVLGNPLSPRLRLLSFFVVFPNVEHQVAR